MERNSGILKILGFSKLYSLFQNMVGAKYSKRWIAEHFWSLQGGEKIIDAGCGPGDCLEFLPSNITYVGFDLSQEYIDTARKEFGDCATFLLGTADVVLAEHKEVLSNADLVICNGVLHHLDDAEALELFRFARDVLKPSGRFVCVEPTYLTHQTALSRWLMSKDRGMNIRKEGEWKVLASRAFDDVSTHILTGLIRIPYTHILIECRA